MQHISQLVQLRHGPVRTEGSQRLEHIPEQPPTIPFVSGVYHPEALALCYAQHSEHRPEEAAGSEKKPA